MNLRQKCKRLKAENEFLKNRPVHPLIIQPMLRDTNVIAYSKEYNIFERCDLPDAVILNDLKNGLAEQLIPYMDIQVYDCFDRSIVRAAIRVLGGTNNG